MLNPIESVKESFWPRLKIILWHRGKRMLAEEGTRVLMIKNERRILTPIAVPVRVDSEAFACCQHHAAQAGPGKTAKKESAGYRVTHCYV